MIERKEEDKESQTYKKADIEKAINRSCELPASWKGSRKRPFCTLSKAKNKTCHFLQTLEPGRFTTPHINLITGLATLSNTPRPERARKNNYSNILKDYSEDWAKVP